MDALKPLPSDGALMATFRSAEKDHWRECESESERRRQMAEDGEAPEGIAGAMDGGHGASENGSVAGGQDFTLSMFARLCLILRDDEEARLANAGSVQPLKKQ